MKVTILGGGPGGLYLALLLRRWCPRAQVEVFERNRPEDTFGFGVVFSDETLSNFLDADAETAAAIRGSFVHWSEIHTYRAGDRTVSSGHGFSGMGRKRLLHILQERARSLGARLHFQREVESLAEVSGSEVVVVADGVNSRFRDELKEHLRPAIDHRSARFSWLGTDYPLTAFTFVFQPSEFGLFVVHAYPYEEGRSTWIVECNEETWKRAGLDQADDARTVAILEQVFASFLRGHRLFPNRSIWRRFPTIRCERWSHENVVLLGDAVHTAHFSIGSGTKLAMEGAIALARALAEEQGPPEAFARYERERKVETLKLQRAAQTSLEWFEHPGRYLDQKPHQFAFNLMTRSKRITFENLRQRDPALVGRGQCRAISDAGRPPARVHALRAARAHDSESHRREPDVPVLGAGGSAGRLAPRAPRLARRRRGRLGDFRDDQRFAGGPHHPRLHRALERCSGAGVEPYRGLRPPLQPREDRIAASPRRSQGFGDPAVGRPRRSPSTRRRMDHARSVGSALRSGLADAARDGRLGLEPDPGGLRPRHSLGGRLRIRFARTPHGPRVPAFELPLAAREPATRRLRRQLGGSTALPARGLRRGS